MTGMAGCVIITLTDLKFFIYFRHFCRKYAEPKRKKQNDVLLDYFDDNDRFADFFNGILFQGRPEVRAEELEEASEVFALPSGKYLIVEG